jgi:hypothetical protein
VVEVVQAVEEVEVVVQAEGVVAVADAPPKNQFPSKLQRQPH